MPGFDPARALARPTGSFVLLDHVELALASDPDGPSIEHGLAWVNRYVVERVESDLELGFFFPGAESHDRPGHLHPRRAGAGSERRAPAARGATPHPGHAEPAAEPAPAAAQTGGG